MSTIKLRLNDAQHGALMDHLLPGDGLEAVAIALCGRRPGEVAHCLTVRLVVPIPYDECRVRTPDRVTWATRRLLPLLEQAARRDMAILKVHSHPGGYPAFSAVDDAADRDLFASVHGWVDGDYPHASAVMLPGGKMFARAVSPAGEFAPISSVAVVGDDLRIWEPAESDARPPEFSRRHAQLFGGGTTALLRRLSVAVVGCSGTGSPVVEMLARLGVGRLVIIDPDRVEEKNLNRILNATSEDARLNRLKVEVMARAIESMGLGTEVVPLPEILATPDAVRAVAECDAVFGCMDSVEGRNLLNRLAAFYTLPYIDVGVKLVADGRGGIEEVCGAVHYVKPGGESLLDRRAYTMGQLKAEGLRRTDPSAYEAQVGADYIQGIREDRPAVISINMHMASVAVNEFLARLHPYRLDDNREFAVVRPSLIQGALYRQSEGPPSEGLARSVGRGDVTPLLDMPELSESGARP